MRRLVIIIFSIAVLISIDYWSKQYMLEILKWADISLIGELLSLQLSYNSGIAFSLPITGMPLQIITAILVIILLVYYFRVEYPKHSYFLDIAYSLIIAGALSHAYERVFIGHVIDFIAVQYFAIFNFADIFISIGAAILFIVYYVRKQ